MNTSIINEYVQIKSVELFGFKPPKLIIVAPKRKSINNQVKQLLLELESNGNPEIELIVELDNRLRGIH